MTIFLFQILYLMLWEACVKIIELEKTPLEETES